MSYAKQSERARSFWTTETRFCEMGRPESFGVVQRQNTHKQTILTIHACVVQLFSFIQGLTNDP